MVTRLSRTVFFLLLCVTMVTPFVWAKGRDITIVYSNDINGQIYPAGSGASRSGGLDRRAAAIQEVKGTGTDILALDAGDLQPHEPQSIFTQVPGITIDVAGNNPSGLRRPLQVGRTIVVSNYSYGRYLEMLTLFLKDPTEPFVDEARITQLERELVLESGKTKGGVSAERRQRMEAELEALRQGNSYRNELIMLSSTFREDATVQKLIADFNAQQKKLKEGCSAR